MSSSVKIIAGLLGCIVLAILWFGRGGEPDSPSATAEFEAPDAAAYEKPNRQMLLGQPDMRGKLGDAESRRPQKGFADSGAAGELQDEAKRARPATVPGRVESGAKRARDKRMARRRFAQANAPESPKPEDTLEHWRDVALNDPDPDERADALTQLDHDDPAAIGVVIEALNDRNPEVRLSALDELWVNTDEPPLDVLAGVLSDPDPEVRAEAVRLIGDSDDPRARQLLEPILGDANEEVRAEAADALEIDEDDPMLDEYAR